MEHVISFLRKSGKESCMYLEQLNSKSTVVRLFDEKSERTQSFDLIDSTINNKTISIEYYSIHQGNGVYKSVVLKNVVLHVMDTFKVIEDENGFMFSIHRMQDFTFKVL